MMGLHLPAWVRCRNFPTQGSPLGPEKWVWVGCCSGRERVSLAFKEQGNALFCKEDWDAAAEMYTLAIRMVPHSHKALCNRACCYLKARASNFGCCHAECRASCCWSTGMERLLQSHVPLSCWHAYRVPGIMSC